MPRFTVLGERETARQSRQRGFVKQSAARTAPMRQIVSSHSLFKGEHSLVAVPDEIVRRIGHGMFFVKKFGDVKAANVDIEVNVAFVKVRRAGRPTLRFEVELLKREPNRFADALALLRS